MKYNLYKHLLYYISNQLTTEWIYTIQSFTGKIIFKTWSNFSISIIFMEINEISWKWSRADRQLPLQLWLSDLTLYFICILTCTVKYRIITVTFAKSWLLDQWTFKKSFIDLKIIWTKYFTLNYIHLYNMVQL